jgi:excisionase family DNA binding protein
LYGAHGAPNTAPACGTTPTLADLAVLHDGPNRLLRPDEVSRHLGVSKATVYKMVKRGDLSHVRIADSIRVRPVDLAAFISSNRASEGTSDSPSPLSVEAVLSTRRQ